MFIYNIERTKWVLLHVTGSSPVSRSTQVQWVNCWSEMRSFLQNYSPSSDCSEFSAADTDITWHFVRRHTYKATPQRGQTGLSMARCGHFSRYSHTFFCPCARTTVPMCPRVQLSKTLNISWASWENSQHTSRYRTAFMWIEVCRQSSQVLAITRKSRKSRWEENNQTSPNATKYLHHPLHHHHPHIHPIPNLDGVVPHWGFHSNSTKKKWGEQWSSNRLQNNWMKAAIEGGNSLSLITSKELNLFSFCARPEQCRKQVPMKLLNSIR